MDLITNVTNGGLHKPLCAFKEICNSHIITFYVPYLTPSWKMTKKTNELHYEKEPYFQKNRPKTSKMADI